MEIFRSSIPFVVQLALLAFVLALLVGWALSVTGGFKSEKGKGLRLLLILPPTNPFALLVLLSRDFRRALPGCVCYVIALLVLPLGGAIANGIESRSLDQVRARIEKAGIPLELTAFQPQPESGDQNIWHHPIFQTLAAAGTYSPEGNAAREALNSKDPDNPYRQLELPRPPRGLNYTVKSPELDFSSSDSERSPYRRLHQTAAAVVAIRDGAITNEDQMPKNWVQSARLIREHYQVADSATRDLAEAIQRPIDRYPYEHEQAMRMLLPHLAVMKGFTSSSAMRAAAAAIENRPEASFELLQMAHQLAHTGDSSLLISRLVQFAQVAIVIDAIRIIQQCHIGSDAQWATLDAELRQWDFPALIPGALVTERSFGNVAISPMLNAPASSAFKEIDAMGASGGFNLESQSDKKPILQSLLDPFLTLPIQASLKQSWRMAILAYDEMIANVEQANQELQTNPWNQVHPADLAKPIFKYGVFAKLLLPALTSAFEKAVDVQHRIVLARVAIALERYRIENAEYPESLSALPEEFAIDPMTDSAWIYQRRSSNSFLLYSVGRNNRDDDGMVSTRTARGTGAKDDVAWWVGEDHPQIPEITIEILEPGGSQMDPAMMQRYGLQPAK